MSFYLKYETIGLFYLKKKSLLSRGDGPVNKVYSVQVWGS